MSKSSTISSLARRSSNRSGLLYQAQIGPSACDDCTPEDDALQEDSRDHAFPVVEGQHSAPQASKTSPDSPDISSPGAIKKSASKSNSIMMKAQLSSLSDNLSQLIGGPSGKNAGHKLHVLKKQDSFLGSPNKKGVDGLHEDGCSQGFDEDDDDNYIIGEDGVRVRKPPAAHTGGVRTAEVKTAPRLKATDAVRTNTWEHRIVTHARFEPIIGWMIVINTLYMGTEYQLDPQMVKDNFGYFEVVDLLFLCTFTFELYLRISVFGTRNVLGNPIYALDFFIVILGLVTEVALPLYAGTFLKGEMGDGSELDRMIRSARALRALRVLRVITLIEQLWGVVELFFYALGPLFWTVLFILIIIFQFTIFTVVLVGRSDMGSETEIRRAQGNFDRTVNTFLSLFQIMTLDGWLEVIQPFFERHPWTYGWFLIFISLTAFALMNLVTVSVLETAREAQARNQQAEDIRQKMTAIQDLYDFPGEGNDLTTKDFFVNHWRDSKTFSAVFSKLDLNEQDAEGFFEALDLDGSGSLDHFELSTTYMELVRNVLNDPSLVALIRSAADPQERSELLKSTMERASQQRIAEEQKQQMQLLQKTVDMSQREIAEVKALMMQMRKDMLKALSNVGGSGASSQRGRGGSQDRGKDGDRNDRKDGGGRSPKDHERNSPRTTRDHYHKQDGRMDGRDHRDRDGKDRHGRGDKETRDHAGGGKSKSSPMRGESSFRDRRELPRGQSSIASNQNSPSSLHDPAAPGAGGALGATAGSLASVETRASSNSPNKRGVSTSTTNEEMFDSLQRLVDKDKEKEQASALAMQQQVAYVGGGGFQPAVSASMGLGNINSPTSFSSMSPQNAQQVQQMQNSSTTSLNMHSQNINNSLNNASPAHHLQQMQQQYSQVKRPGGAQPGGMSNIGAMWARGSEGSSRGSVLW
ncbi:unnamed protein product [Amoebophrya sp. A25]|nr:unnamed protein product [Amoebophrya sp. A25]|eukprot:GSA25T00008781001.1